jgi:hypothetical protein
MKHPVQGGGAIFNHVVEDMRVRAEGQPVSLTFPTDPQERPTGRL